MRMARAKCKICGTQLDTKEAYKVTDKNGKNRYFCSQSEFEAEETRKKKAAEDKDRVYRLICNILGEQEIINTILFKEWQVWLKVADNEKIGNYLEENQDYLTSAIARLNSSEFARIRYLSAIIKDKIKGFVPKVEVEEVPRVVDTSFELFEPTIEKNPQIEEQVLYDVEDDLL
jgi:YHS domain-containing protein